MHHGNAPDRDPPIFSAVLTPYRALGGRGFLVLLTGVGVASGIAGLVCLAVGAWPVTGFCGLDILLVYIAFRLNYRAGRIFERVRVAFGFLEVTRKPQRGRPQHWVTNPLWARVEPGEDAVRIAAGGRELAVASFLSPDERDAFADALKAALVRARVR